MAITLRTIVWKAVAFRSNKIIYVDLLCPRTDFVVV